MKINKIITFWGFCDLGFLIWYFGWNVIHKRIPFYYDITQSQMTAKSFEAPLPIFICAIGLLAYSSLLFSGFLLLKKNKLGVFVSYIQCPFRLTGFIPPSLFFITWPVKYFFDMTSVNPELTIKHPVAIISIFLVLLSEIIKITSVILWHETMYKQRITSGSTGSQGAEPL